MSRFHRFGGSGIGSGRRLGSMAPTYVRFLSLRLLIFVVVLVICIAVGLKGLPGVLVALLISGVLSYPLAKRQREAIVREIQDRRTR
jgi:hypothetical protein